MHSVTHFIYKNLFILFNCTYYNEQFEFDLIDILF